MVLHQPGGGGAKRRHRQQLIEEKKSDEDQHQQESTRTIMYNNNSHSSSATSITHGTTDSYPIDLPPAVSATSTTSSQWTRRRRAGRKNSAAKRRRTKKNNARVLIALLGTLVLALLCVWSLTLVHSVRTLAKDATQRVAARVLLHHHPSSSVSSTTMQHWHHPQQLVHVVQTRFMQFQPHLVALGQARLDLFRALTVPSLAQQSVQDFLWIIRTDPDLDPAIRDELIATVESDAMPHNAILVASNENPEGFRGSSCVADITPETVMAGSLDLLRSYHRAADTHTVLETRLDADDALATDFVELIQSYAAEGDELQQQSPDHWRVYCAENHVEYQYSSPWNHDNNDNNTGVEGQEEEKGALLGLKSGMCITPGLTFETAFGAHRSDIPVSKHTRIQKTVPACPEVKDGGADGSSSSSSKCLIKLGGDLPLALRARTPTSAGMDHVLIAQHTEDTFPMQHLQKSKWKDSQKALWESLPVLFGVEATDLWRARAGIQANLAAIAKDALEGQCTKGHSCKDGSKAVLKELVDTYSNAKEEA